MRTLDEALYAMRPVGKLNQVSQQALLHIENSFIELTRDIFRHVPECADRTSALRKLLEAKMMCSQAISHDKGASNDNQKAQKEKNEAQSPQSSN